jgi:hypothetical protein
MPANIAAALTHVWPGIRTHAIAIVQPPGIGIAAPIMRAEDNVSTAAIVNTARAAA